MSELVPTSDIEAIVGANRHPDVHIGRAVSAEQTVYILHPDDCREYFDDLRDCPFSKALDKGIDAERWEGFEDQPVRLWVSMQTLRLVPERRYTPENGEQ